MSALFINGKTWALESRHGNRGSRYMPSLTVGSNVTVGVGMIGVGTTPP